MIEGQLLKFLIDFASAVHANASFGRRPTRNIAGTLPGGDKIHSVIHVFVIVDG